MIAIVVFAALAAVCLCVVFAVPTGRTVVYVANSDSGTISRFRLDQTTGNLEAAGETELGGRVSPLAASRDGKRLFAAVRGPDPAVVSLALDSSDGSAEILSRVPIPAPATYMKVDAGGRFLLAASYGGDLAFVMPIGPDGVVQETPVCVERPGRNPHCILLDHSNRFAYVPCLGSDLTAQFLFDDRTGELRRNNPPLCAFPRESGPRHLAVSPDNRFAYILSELSGEIASCALDRESGALHPLHSVSILPPGVALPKGTYHPPDNSRGGENSPFPVVWAAEIRVSPDGRFVYASERTASRLIWFAADTVSGRLDFAGSIETERQPRAFTLDPKGRFLVAAGERSGGVAAYAVDSVSGTLSRIAAYATGERPNWVEMVHFS